MNFQDKNYYFKYNKYDETRHNYVTETYKTVKKALNKKCVTIRNVCTAYLYYYTAKCRACKGAGNSKWFK